MFAVIFEVEPKKERFGDYLAIAKSLRPALEKIDGFISNERFASARRPGRLLSLSIWRDEKALIRWRTLGLHHEAQLAGRTEIFADYRLRVAEILTDPQIAPGGLVEQRFDETEIGDAKVVTLSEVAAGGEEPDAAGLALSLGLPERGGDLVDHESFAGIAEPQKLLLLAGWRTRAAAETWRPASAASRGPRHRLARVVRDYGIADRREAPQYYPPAPEVERR